MGKAITVNSKTFQKEVVEPSFGQPVLVDFFATWCGPCQLLKPMLEGLVEEYDFILAKVDIDENPDLAQAYQVEGVPDVRIVYEGRMARGFVGVVPDAQLRQMLEELGLTSTLQDQLDQAVAAANNGQGDMAHSLFTALLDRYPDRPKLLLTVAQFYQGQGELTQAQSFLDKISPKAGEIYDQAIALKELLELQLSCAEPATNANDQQFQYSIVSALGGDYQGAFEGLLGIVKTDRHYRKDGARKAMITLFNVLGSDHELTQTYRRKLTRMLY